MCVRIKDSVCFYPGIITYTPVAAPLANLPPPRASAVPPMAAAMATWPAMGMLGDRVQQIASQ